MTSPSQQSGHLHENHALAYLQNAGLSLVAQNYQCKAGEIDLVMLDRMTLVFVEVRYRKHHAFGNSLDSISHTKQSRIIKTAKFFLLKHSQFQAHDCRFDVIGFDSQQGKTSLQWIKSAFQEQAF